MAEGYEDIESLISDKNSMLDSALEQQQNITNQQTEMNVAELERNKEEVDKDATKTNKALYSEYKKASNPYGANAEELASLGLGNSGYAESSQTSLYNTFQKNVTDTLNNARELKADFDFQISQARQSGDITLAQNALEIYMQKMNLLSEEYELKNNREQFLYQKEQDALAQSNWEKEYAYQQERDAVSDSQWQQTYDYQKSRDAVSDSQWQQTFDYQKSRDKVSDDQWEKEYQLSKKASASSSKSSSSNKSSSSGTTSSTVSLSSSNSKSSIPTKANGEAYTPQEIISNIKNIAGANVSNPIKDGISGKTFKSVDALLNYYGYVGIDD